MEATFKMYDGFIHPYFSMSAMCKVLYKTKGGGGNSGPDLPIQVSVFQHRQENTGAMIPWGTGGAASTEVPRQEEACLLSP